MVNTVRTRRKQRRKGSFQDLNALISFATVPIGLIISPYVISIGELFIWDGARLAKKTRLCQRGII